ncbi:MAG TPA: condensation domain-containing protein, partial [Pyrinomonadaceae bacterium]
TLILRVKLQDTQTFAELVKAVQKISLDAFEHQALPFEKLVHELNVERVPGYPPLYQVVFNFQNASLIESSNPLAEGETMQNEDFPFVHSNTSKVDLNLTVTQNGSRISGGFEYNTDLFESETIENMISHFRIIAENIVDNPSIPLMDIPLTVSLPADEHGAEEAATRDTIQLIEEGKFSFELND